MLLAGTACADIVVERDRVVYGVFASGSVISITLPSDTNDHFIRIYDNSADKSGAIGRVELIGNGPGFVDVIVARPDPMGLPANDSFPNNASFPLVFNGAASFGTHPDASGRTFIVTGPADSLGRTLEQRTRLAIAATSTISGAIRVGTVFRLQAFNAGIEATGTISANVTGTFQGIQYVTAGGEISGAMLTETFGTVASSISEVSVGPSANAVGITGDVINDGGSILRVQSTGPIGSALRRSTIRARDGIGQIRTRNDSTIAKDMYVDVEARRVGGATATSPVILGRIESSGNIYGTINADYILIGAPTDALASALSPGVYAQGDMMADVNIEVAVRGTIIGKTIQGSITIGRQLFGSIIAWDVDNASAPPIPLISIGHNEALEDTIKNSYNRGFIGEASGDFTNIRDPGVRDQIYQRPAPSLTESDDAFDSLIIAPSIGTIDIAEMTRYEYYPVPEQVFNGTIFVDRYWEAEESVPVIESPAIGHLKIDLFREGVVWSGKFDTFDNLFYRLNDTDKSDDFLALGGVLATPGVPDAEIGCMGTGAQLWISGFNRVVVDRDVRGRINVLNFAPTSVISIGGALSTQASTPSACGCLESGPVSMRLCDDLPAFASQQFNIFATSPSLNPRTLAALTLERGTISVAGADAFHGQIIINAQNSSASPADLWKGRVLVAEAEPEPADQIVFEPRVSTTDPITPFTAPYYTSVSSAFGSGSIGLAPFHVHESDCYPVATASPGIQVPYGVFAVRQTPIVVTYYGPVTVGDNTLPPVRVENRNGFGGWDDVTSSFTFALQGRNVKIMPGGNGSPFQRIGEFRVSPYTAPPTLRSPPADDPILNLFINLRCDQVATNPPVASYPHGGYFYFSLGCDAMGYPHPADICGAGATYDNGVVDVGPDGMVTIEDFLVFLTAFGDGVGCPSTPNHPCNPADVSGPGGTYYVGTVSVDPDGQLTIEDFLIFLAAFADGCN